jgi:DNA-binding response OmpR family regulator
MSRELLGVLLQAEGYAVDSADSGESALDLLRRGDPAPDLVLADVQLPGVSGGQFARKLRRACGPATLLLAISGGQPPTQAIALFDGFLMKPFKMEQVAAALRAHPLQLQLKSHASKSSPAAASPSKTASKKSMKGMVQEQEARSTETPQADASGGNLVLNEKIYQQLAVSMPVQQLQEMYAMCVDDARRRIAGMRRLAADHDATRFVREAHSIKGGCGMLGATELHRLAAQLEAAGLEIPSPSAPEDVNSLDELSAACDRLERMLGSRV